MDRTERVELTVLCLLTRGQEILLQDRKKPDWPGYTFPGGHIEPGESIVEAVIREMKEETGLDIRHPRLCGVKQFPTAVGRYVVFLFRTEEFTGTLTSSEEGEMHWVPRDRLDQVNIVEDFAQLLSVFDREDLTEFQYVGTPEHWHVELR